MMKLGALLGPVVDPEANRFIANQARQLEVEGFQSLWSAQAIGRGFMMTDPFICLSTAAAVTETVALGTAVIQVPLYHPLDLAHRIFSLQQVCGKRLVVGLGAGSTAQDFDAFDRPYQSRFSDFLNLTDTLKTVLAEGRIHAKDLTPWSTLVGGPPLLLGSWGQGVSRAAESFDGWIASAHYRGLEEILEAHRRYRWSGGKRAIVSTIQLGAGTDLVQLRDQLQCYAEAGFDEAVVMFLPGAPGPGQVRALLP